MKRKLTISIIFAILIILIALCIVSKAATTGSFNLSTSSLTITEGKTATFNISLSKCEGLFTIASSDASIATVSKAESWIDGSDTITVTAKKAGTATITVTASEVADNQAEPEDVTGSKTIKVTVKSAGTTTDNTTTTTNNSTTTSTDNNTTTVIEKSNVADLKNLGIKPNDFSGFRAATTTYNVTVPKSVEKITIYAEAKDSKATITGTGSKTLQIGKNTFAVKVTAEDKKTTKTYTLNITREEEERVSTDATLKDFGINPKEYDFSGFKPVTLSYKAEVPNDIDKINIYATAANAKAVVTGAGSKNLKEGENTFEVKVTAEDKKTTKTYTLKVTRKAKEEEKPEEKETEEEETAEENLDEKEPEKEIIGLTNIMIDGYELNPKFSNDVHEYTLKIKKGITRVAIDTETSSDSIKVDIAGNEDLDENKTITILVYNTKENTTETYQINVEEEATTIQGTSDYEQDKIKREKIYKYGGIAAIVIIIIIYAIYKKRKNDEMDEEWDEEDEDEEDEDKMEIPTSLQNKTHKVEEQDEYEIKPRNRKGKRFKD